MTSAGRHPETTASERALRDALSRLAGWELGGLAAALVSNHELDRRAAGPRAAVWRGLAAVVGDEWRRRKRAVAEFASELDSLDEAGALVPPVDEPGGYTPEDGSG